MTLESDADRLGMLQALGETVTVNSVSISAIFEHEYAEVQGIEARRPTLMVRSSDVSGVGHGVGAVVDGVNYLIKNIQNSGGMTLLVLEKV